MLKNKHMIYELTSREIAIVGGGIDWGAVIDAGSGGALAGGAGGAAAGVVAGSLGGRGGTVGGAFVGAAAGAPISANQPLKNGRLWSLLKHGDSHALVLIDSGATMSVFPQTWVEKGKASGFETVETPFGSRHIRRSTRRRGVSAATPGRGSALLKRRHEIPDRWSKHGRRSSNMVASMSSVRTKLGRRLALRGDSLENARLSPPDNPARLDRLGRLRHRAPASCADRPGTSLGSAGSAADG